MYRLVLHGGAIEKTSADKGQRHKADSKRHIEEIKCPVRRNVCGTDRRHQKTETDRA